MEPQPRPVEPAEPPDGFVPRWGLGDVGIGLAAGLALSSLMAALWLSLTGEEELDLTGQAVSQLGLWTGMVGAAFLATRRKGRRSVALDFGFRGRWSDLWLGIGVAVAVQLLLLPLVGLLLRPLLGDPEVSGPVQDLLDKAKGPAFVGLVLSVAVGAPLVEELFFRGLLLRSLQRRMPTAFAILLSSAAFGLAHASALPAKAVVLVMVSLTVFGAVLAALAVRTGRLGPGIAAHSAFNLITVVVLAATG